MSDLLEVTGMVLSAMPIGENDRRLVILTAERGKISAFAKGARKPNSPMVAGSRPFSFGTFHLYEGRNSYTVRTMEIRRYFEEIAADLETVCYGTYFCEFADYYGREGVDEREMINLLYAALLALGKNRSPSPRSGPCSSGLTPSGATTVPPKPCMRWAGWIGSPLRKPRKASRWSCGSRTARNRKKDIASPENLR